MKARVTVEVLTERGTVVRERRVIEVGSKIVAMLGALTEDVSTERMIAQDIMSHAMRSVEPSARASLMMGGENAPPVAGNKGLTEALGLNLVQSAAAEDAHRANQPSPGPIGFGPSDQRSLRR